MASGRRPRIREKAPLLVVASGAAARGLPHGRRRLAANKGEPKGKHVVALPKRPKGRPRVRLTLRQKVAAIVWLSILIFISMTVFRDVIARLGSWGYFGAFLVNGISSASVVLPGPGGGIVMLMAADYHPLPLGIAAGLGGAIGSLTSYAVGVQTRPVIQRRRIYHLLCRLMNRFGAVILFLMTLPPVSPGDFGGILAGATGYPVRKFLVVVGVASIIKMVALTYLAAASLAWLREWLPSWAAFLLP